MSRRLLTLVLICLTVPAFTGASASTKIAGRVLVPGDSPLAEAEITLTPLTDVLSELQARESDQAELEPIRTVTDAAGRYEISAPHPGMWRVQVAAAGYAPLQAVLRPLIEPTVLDDAVLTPDVGLTVRVSDPEGRPVKDATIVVVIDRGPMDFGGPPWQTPRLRGITAEDGSVRIAHAERDVVSVSVAAAGYPVRELRGRRGTSARVRLQPGFTRTLQVLSPEDKGVEGALVALGDQPHITGVSGPDGKLQVVLQKGATVETWAIHADGRRARTRLGPPPTDAEEPLTLLLPDRLSLVGRLIDAESRKAVADGVVWDVRNPARAERSDAAGGFVLGGPAGMRLDLTAGAPGYLSADPFDFQLGLDGRPGPTLALRPAAAVAGTVVDGDGEPVSGAKVELTERVTPGMMRIEIGRPTTVPRALSGPDGEFHIGSIDPDNSYDLRVDAEGFAPAKEPVSGLEPYRTRAGVRVTVGRGHAVSGRLVDGDGAAVADADVKLTPAPSAGGGGFVRMMRMSGGQASFETASDQEGRFEIVGLPTGRFDLEAHRRGFAKRRLPGIEISQTEATVDLGEVELSYGESLQGYVRDTDGLPIEGVEVFVSEGGGGMMMVMAGPGPGPERDEPDALTDPAGWFTVSDLGPDERYELRFSRTGFVSATASAIEVPRVEPVEVSMDPASDIAGTVLDPQGEPIVGAQVMLRRTQTIEMGGNVMAMMMMTDAATDQEGRFLFEDQEPGTISLSAVASGYQEAKRDNLEVPKGEDLLDIEIPLPAGAILEGRVLSPDGRAAIGATVAPAGEGEGPGGIIRPMNRVGVDGNGYYRIEGLEAGPLSIEAEHPDYPRVVRDAELREGRNTLDLSFEGGQEVTGRVVDASGGPVADAAVQLVRAGRRWGGPETMSETDGSFTLPGVQDGDYSVQADAEGFASFDGDLPVNVAGEPVHGLEVRLDRGAAIYGRVTGLEPDKLGDVGVSTGGTGLAGFGGASVDHEGNYRVENLVPGDYTVTARLSDSGRQANGQITLEPGVTETRLDLEFGAGLTLSGTAVQGDAPVVGATVYAEGLEIDHTGWSQTDNSGYFSIEGLESGSYQVHVRNFQTGLAYTEQVEMATSREIRLELPTASVGGRVLDSADRDPLQGVTVTLTDPQSSGRAGLPAHTTTTDLEGRFLLSSVADGQWHLAANRKGFAASSMPVTVQFDKAVDDLEIVMEATEGLTLEARLPSGAPPDEISVAVLDAGGGSLSGGSYTTGENGRVRLSSVPAGRWELIVSAAGAATSTIAVQAPGPPVPVQLQPATSLVVEVAELQGTSTLATVSVTGSDGRPFRTLSWTAQPRSEWRMEGGRLEFASLPPGAWNVTVVTIDGRRWAGSTTTSAGAGVALQLDAE